MLRYNQRLLMENENRKELKNFNSLENQKFKTKSMIAAAKINSGVFQVIYKTKKLGEWANP